MHPDKSGGGKCLLNSGWRCGDPCWKHFNRRGRGHRESSLNLYRKRANDNDGRERGAQTRMVDAIRMDWKRAGVERHNTLKILIT